MKTKAFFIYRINTVQMVCSGEIKYYLMQTRPNENEPRKYRFSAESTNSLYQLGLSTFHSFKNDKTFSQMSSSMYQCRFRSGRNF